jgi:hypothetical protein
MNEKEMAYNRVISLMKNNPPLPENSEELTAGIMAKIDGLSKGKRTGKRLLIAGWVSTVAAAFLICFLVNETFFLPDNGTERTTVFTHDVAMVSIDRPLHTGKLPAKKIREMTPAEKQDLLHSLMNDKRKAGINRMQIRTDLLRRMSD